jgi:hypothetical protein
MAAKSRPNTFTLRLALLDHQPEVWRRLLVPGSVRLDELHLIFQEAMGWTNSHLHQFRIGHASYGMHAEDWPDEELHEVKFKFADVAEQDERATAVYLPAQRPTMHAGRRSCTWMYETRGGRALGWAGRRSRRSPGGAR